MELSYLLSTVCLSVTGGLACLGVFYRQYHDTLLERIGLSAVSIWAGVRLYEILLHEAHFTAVQLFLHAGLACFAAGFALETRRFSQNRQKG